LAASLRQAHRYSNLASFAAVCASARARNANGARRRQAGAEIYEFQPTMFHCKVMVVDGLWSSVGSTNFDNRSFRLNDEANLNIFSAEFAERQTAIFNEDLKRSRRVTYEEWQNRSWTEKLSERAEAMLNSQLQRCGAPTKEAIRWGSMSAKRLGVEPQAGGFLKGDARPFETRCMRIQVAGMVDDQSIRAPDLVGAALRIRNRRPKLLYFRHQAGRREHLSKILPVHCDPFAAPDLITPIDADAAVTG
jgi:PLD-like domain